MQNLVLSFLPSGKNVLDFILLVLALIVIRKMSYRNIRKGRDPLTSFRLKKKDGSENFVRRRWETKYVGEDFCSNEISLLEKIHGFVYASLLIFQIYMKFVNPIRLVCHLLGLYMSFSKRVWAKMKEGSLATMLDTQAG